jgi:hypothetical protein
MVINHGISTTYIDQHIKRQIILLADLLFTRKDGENRKENRRGGHRCISMKLIKGPKHKKNREHGAKRSIIYMERDSTERGSSE